MSRRQLHRQRRDQRDLLRRQDDQQPRLRADTALCACLLPAAQALLLQTPPASPHLHLPLRMPL